MKKELSITIIVLMGLLISTHALAKEKKIKFGKVSIEEVEMKIYELDTSATAVILYERGYYDGINHQYVQFRRIKILKKEGYFMADNKFYASATSTFKGKTYNLENGKIVESKLGKSSIFKEKMWEYSYVYNVAMPDVKVGSVIDIEMKYAGFPSIWYFQKSIPVVKSEIELGDSDNLTFRKQIGGIIRPKEVGRNHWMAVNVPAFISEAYLSSDKNYRTRIEFDISETHFPGYYPMEYAYSWKSIDNLLDKRSSFGKALIWSNSFLNKYVKEIEATAGSENEKVKMAVETIKSLVEYNGSKRVGISEDNLSIVLDEKEGNSADINLMLIALLRKLDIETYPLVMSSRSNGMLHPVNPSLWKLDYVLAYAKVDGKFMPLDATSDLLPYDMLPIRCLNYNGQVLDGKGTQRISLIPQKKYAKRTYYDLSIDDNMTLTGKVSFKKAAYAAYSFRIDFEDYLSKQDYVDNLMDKYDGIAITDFSIENINELDKPISEKYDAEIEDVVIMMDNQAYINMFMFEQIEENPFKSEERKYPVDFTYTRANVGTIRIKLPENFTVAELPDPVNITLPEKAAQFSMMYQFSNNVLTLNYKLLINRVVFGEDVYANIKEFYGLVVSNQSKPVIININE